MLVSIRSRVLATLAVIGIIILSMSAAAALVFFEVERDFTSLQRDYVDPFAMLAKTNNLLTNTAFDTIQKLASRNMSVEDGADILDAVLAESEADWWGYRASLRPVPALGADQRVALVDDLDIKIIAALQLVRDAAWLAHHSDHHGLSEMANFRLYQVFEPVNERIKDLVVLQAAETNRQRDAIFGFLSKITVGFAVAAILALIVLLGVSGFIWWRVAWPIGEITGVMGRLAAGELSLTIPFSGQRDEIGQMARALTVFRQAVQQVHRQADDLRIAQARAEAAAQAKADFLAIVSHEIRTPMNGIVSMADMLDHSALTEAQRRTLGVIRRSSDALLVIIDDILDFSKIEAEKLTIEHIPFSLVELVEDVRRLMEGKAGAQGINLRVQLAPELPERLIGDPTRLRQILLNLLSNAVKFTPSGTVTLTLAPQISGGVAGLGITVADTGIGLTQEQLARLFQPFQQADDSTARRYGGTGLGLSICQRLVELMGGKIDVQSEYGVGTRFSVALPLPPAELTAPRHEGSVTPERGWAAPDPATAEAAGVLILVAEDNVVNQTILRMMLEQRGYAHDLVETGQHAQEKLAEKRYGLLLTDLHMPDLDGFSLTAAIRLAEQGGSRHLPIIALSAEGGQAVEQACLEAGMDGYLKKPFEAKALAEIIARWLPAAQSLRRRVDPVGFR